MRAVTSNVRKWHAAAILAFVLLIVLRLALSNRLPSYLLPGMPHDDGWVLSRTLFMLKGDWLGAYDQLTLIKGVFPPLLLAFSAYSGIGFGMLNTVLYCFACLIFVASIRPIIKNQMLQVLCFAILLFNPISYALHTGQRIYRIGMGQWEILLILGCLIAVFLRRNDSWRSLLKWEILGGLTLGLFLQTREDGAWIYPFVFGSIALTILVFILEKAGSKKKIILYGLPVLIAFAISGITVTVNYVRYGAPVINDRSGGNYAKVAGDLNSIAPNADEDKLYKSEAFRDRYYTIYASTMEKAFLASPTLNSASPFIRDAIRAWGDQEDLKTGQLSTDHMLFALRDGVKMAGYYQSLPETEDFYRKVHKELELAFEGGVLKRRGFLISPLVAPFQKGDLAKSLALMPGAIRDIIEFRGISSAALSSIGTDWGIKEFGLISGGDYFVLPGWLTGSGWAFAKDDGNRLTAAVYDRNGMLVGGLPLGSGEDVFRHMLATKGVQYLNAKTPRFSFKIDGYDLKSGVSLRFFDKNGNLFRQIAVDGSASCGEDALFHYCIDSLKSDSSVIEFYSRFVGRANFVGGLYQKYNLLISVMACLSYFFATIMLIYEIRKKASLKVLWVWSIMTGLFSTFILFVFGMCILEATSFNSLVYWYTAPAYILLLMFNVVSLGWGIEAIFQLKKRVDS